MDEIEFYLGGKESPMARVTSSMPPAVGDVVSIRGESYRVSFRNFALDYADRADRKMRCAVQLVKLKAR